jgi:hypothetical protein
MSPSTALARWWWTSWFATESARPCSVLANQAVVDLREHMWRVCPLRVVRPRPLACQDNGPV